MICRELVFYRTHPTIQIQLGQQVLDHSDYSIPIRQHELDRSGQESIVAE